MLSNKEFKQLAIKSGSNIKEVEKYYKKAQNEAKSLGKENDDKFVLEMLKDLLELDESKNKIVNEYVNSDQSFDGFLETLISSDIPQSNRPEKVAKVVVIGQEEEDEIEEELLISKDGEDTVLDNDVKDKENLLVDGCRDEKI